MLRNSLLIAAALAAANLAAQAPAPARYVVPRAVGPVKIDARLDEEAWKAAPPMGAFHFPWHKGGDKEPTEAKMLWDDHYLYVSWRVTDRSISAYERQRHGPVSKDDCVEIFIAPNPAKPANYYTWEINAIGTSLNRARTDWNAGGPATWEPEDAAYRATFQGQEKKDESPDDREWVVELRIPWRNFVRDAAHLPPWEGDEWRANLNRIGGKTNVQASSWSPIGTPAPNFHTPAFFGVLEFGGREANQASPAQTSRARFTPADAAAGKALYNRSCTMCHGLDGAAGDRAPALGAQRRYLRSTPADLYDAIKNGIPGTGMPGSPLPQADANRIVAYILSLRATALDVEVAGNRERGRAIFAGKGGCSGCHMVNGQGGVIGPDLSNLGAERSLAAIRDALTVSKPTPPRGYAPVRVRTKAGETFEGLIKNQHNTSYQILARDGRWRLLLAGEIAGMEPLPGSWMPAGVDKRLTAAEFEDLMAYLSRLARKGDR